MPSEPLDVRRHRQSVRVRWHHRPRPAHSRRESASLQVPPQPPPLSAVRKLIFFCDPPAPAHTSTRSTRPRLAAPRHAAVMRTSTARVPSHCSVRPSAVLRFTRDARHLGNCPIEIFSRDALGSVSGLSVRSTTPRQPGKAAVRGLAQAVAPWRRASTPAADLCAFVLCSATVGPSAPVPPPRCSFPSMV